MSWRGAAALLRSVDESMFSGVDRRADSASGSGAVLMRSLDQLGHAAQQPPTWAGAACVLAAAGGRAGRRAAARGAACYAAAAIVANVAVKPVVRRPRPPQARRQFIGPITSSFPSGHSATDVAFVLGASQELPAAFLPLAAVALVAHWSLVRSRGHYASDVIIGGLVGTAVAWSAARLFPPPLPGTEAAPTRGAEQGS